MTILPLVERELRVRARSPAGYWTRFAAALTGTLLCVSMLMVNPNPAFMGRAAFDGLVVAAFILCCFSGFLTVDVISRERREGTLGLLFLTRVKVLDVLLGNFGAAGIASLCALAAFVPVLIVPVLAGGVSGGEATRKVFALFDTMILSLAAGLWASARGRTWWTSARSAALVLTLIMFGPPLLGSLLWRTFGSSELWWPCPMSALGDADDPIYRKSAAPYWFSIAVVHAISWLLMIGAGIRLRRALREEDETSAKSVQFAPRSKPVADKERTPGFMLFNFEINRRRREPLAEGEGPLEWLMSRQKGLRAVVWTGVLLPSVFSGVFYFIVFSRGSWGGSLQGISVAFYIVEGCLFAWVASRFFIEARRDGELELLMTTPEGAKTIVASQWQSLKKVFRWPVVVLILPWGLLSMIFMQWSFVSQYAAYYLFSQLLSAVNTLAFVGALLWAGMWFGWSERSQARAIVRIVLVAQGAPYLISLLGSKVVRLFMQPGQVFNNGSSLWLLLPWFLPQMVRLLYYVWLIKWAKRRLVGAVGHVPAGSWFGHDIALYLRGVLSYHD